VLFDGYKWVMFEWNAHRFSGGALALDLANTVVWSDIPEKRADRFADRNEIARFAGAATLHRRAEIDDQRLVSPQSERDVQHLLELRNAIDRWLRPQSFGQNSDHPLHNLFAACALASSGGPAGPSQLWLGEACARSVMRFMDQKLVSRLKSCPSCHWLYLDNSKNQSRQWCDMRVCGNRAKARTFYARQKLLVLET
jgi:predicted RNA-binding Zn ribbon-like protein